MRRPSGCMEFARAATADIEGSAKSGSAYPVTARARLVPEFIDLALRLKPGEAGIVKSQWGFHVMQRVK